MKRFFAILLCLLISGTFLTFGVSANTVTPKPESTIEYLDDGSYIITEWETSSTVARSSKWKTKTSTYYTASDSPVFAVSLTGNFTYTSGVSAKATSQSVSVTVYSDSASYVTKSSSRSGASVYGSGTVYYAGRNRTLSLQMTCDVYGNIS